MEFDLETVTEGEVVRLALRGEFDLSVVPRVEDELKRVEAASPETLVLDLSGLEFMDSSGLRSVVTADDRARTAGRRFVVVNGPDPVRRVFEITKVDERIELVDDLSAVSRG
jgi:anti-sigma B factor antagonist